MSEAEPLGPGSRVARYILGPRIGEGTLGVVFAAHDPELDRRVAIKLMHGAATAGGPDDRLREAQATAALVHRNLVTVHDVGEVDGRLFIAMELIDGPTLRTWLSTPRSWREIVRVFCAAGEGLAAAHDAGVLHLDFKPENVLLAEDGRVAVTDFGLAPIDRATTGTAKDDQLAFCTALQEALFGAGAHGSRRVPGWVRRAVQRGLAAAPDDRHPDLRTLLQALAPPRRWSTRTTTIAVGATIGVGAIAFAAWPSPPAPVDYCDRVVERIDGVWNVERRATLEAAFLATREPAAADAWALVSTNVDEFARAWVDGQLEVCRAQRSNELPPDTITLRVTCLERQLGKATSLLDALGSADSQTVLNAEAVLGGLGDPSVCTDDQASSRRETSRATIAAGLRKSLDEDIARAESLVDTAKYAEAMVAAQATLERARAAGDIWIAAEALLVIASVHQWFADGQAEQAFHDALSAAIGVKHDRIAAIATLGLIEQWSPGSEGGIARVDQWRGHCEALISALGGSPALEAELALAVGTSYQKSGRYDEAATAYEAALALPRDTARTVLYANALANLGGIAAMHGRYAEALVRFRQGRELLLESSGPHHPDTASASLNIGSALAELGDLQGARAEHLLALQGLEENLGPLHPALAPPLRMLAWNALSRREFAEGLPYARRALEIAEKTHEDNGDESTARSLAMLATLELELERFDDAYTHSKSALALAKSSLGEDHPSFAEFEIDFALAATRHGDDDRARAAFGSAIARRVKAMGPDDAEVGRALAGLAELELLRGNHDAAVESATRAHAIAHAATMERAVGRAETGFLLARVLMASGDAAARARARALAQRAHADLVAAGPEWSAMADTVDAWRRSARTD